MLSAFFLIIVSLTFKCLDACNFIKQETPTELFS